jgi:multidrug efflux pump subunit AcrB
VIATLLAEIYGPDAATRRAVAEETKKLFKSIPFIVDVDDSYGVARPRLRLNVKRDAVEFFGLSERDISDSLGALLNGTVAGYSHRGEGRNPIEIAIRLPKSDMSWNARLTATPVAVTQTAQGPRTIELGEVMESSREPGSLPMFRRDGHFAEMVTAELAGAYEAPIYGMLEVASAVDKHDWGKLPKPEIRPACAYVVAQCHVDRGDDQHCQKRRGGEPEQERDRKALEDRVGQDHGRADHRGEGRQ